MVKKAIEHYNYGISHDIFREPVTTYATLAVTALEKKVPQKVINKGYFYGYINKCPVCGAEAYNNVPGKKAKYCQDCGQALDWSE